MIGGLYKRGDVYWYTRRLGGVEIRKSLFTKDIEIARMRACTYRRFLELAAMLEKDVELERMIREHLLDKKGRRGWVYFAKATLTGLVKIGFAVNVKKRMVQVRTHAGPIDVIGRRRGTRELEQAIHKSLAHLRVTGEWFKDTDELRQQVVA